MYDPRSANYADFGEKRSSRLASQLGALIMAVETGTPSQNSGRIIHPVGTVVVEGEVVPDVNVPLPIEQ